MKLKLLALVSTLALISVPTTGLRTEANNGYFVNSLDFDKWLPPTSMSALQKNVNNYVEKNSKNWKKWWEGNEQSTQRNYDQIINTKRGILDVVKMKLIKEETNRLFSDFFSNETSSSQTVKTQSYSKTVSKTRSFSISLNEEVGITAKVNFLFEETEINATISSEQTWTKEVSTEETTTIESQEIIVKPYSTLKVDYNLEEGLYNVDGLIRYSVPLTEEFLSSYYSNIDDSTVLVTSFTFKDLIYFLNHSGYGSLMKMDAKEFSIISTDNPEKPSIATVNIPISWKVKGSRLNVHIKEAPIRGN